MRRAQLRAELDAYYARLCGLTRDELRCRSQRSPRRGFSWQDVPCAEGIGNQAIWRIQDATFGTGRMG